MICLQNLVVIKYSDKQYLLFVPKLQIKEGHYGTSVANHYWLYKGLPETNLHKSISSP